MEILLIRIELKAVNYFQKMLDLSLGFEYGPKITSNRAVIKNGSNFITMWCIAEVVFWS